MSEIVLSTKVERTCEGCGNKYEYEMVGMIDHPDVIRELEGWTELRRRLWNGQQWVEMVGQAIGLECVQKVATKMEIAVIAQWQHQDEQEAKADDIDLAGLRASSIPDPAVN